MMSPVENTVGDVSLLVVAWSSFLALVSWGEYLGVIGQVAGILAALSTSALAIRKIYLSYTRKYKHDD